MIELFADKKHSIRGDIYFSINKGESNMLSLGYGNFILDYIKAKNKNINISNVSLGYEFAYYKFNLLFYSSYSAGVSKYELDISKNGYFISNKIGVKKKILGANLGIFGYFSKDFIDDLEINIMNFGVSFGL